MRDVKSGNRQINTASRRIAMTHLRDGAGRLYYRKRIEMGDPPMATLRRLKLRLAGVVYNRMKADTAVVSRILVSARPVRPRRPRHNPGATRPWGA